MKKIACMVALITVSVLSVPGASYAAATLNWGCGSPYYAYQSDGSTLVNGDASSAVAGFVQLIYVGADGYDGFSPVGSGAVGNDAVVDTTWVGNGVMSYPDGRFLDTYSSSYAIGSKFVIRFFDSASPDYAGGLVPASGNYGLSQIYTTTADPAGGGQEDFFFTSNVSATTPVPEPSTVALMLAGLGILAGRRFLRS